jgi:succinate-semialdehyde dehydrogenase/glutarate-semialdehyde dehydrogenase
MAIASVNPATGELVKQYEPFSSEQIERKISAAQRAFQSNRNLSFQERARCMQQAAGVLESDKRAFATLATLEMGKPLRQAIAEIEKCAWACRFFAEHAAQQLADEHITTDAADSLVRYEPLGVVLAVMPWNFPFWQVFRFAAPALMAGNAALLKHASNVPQCALAIEAIFKRSGFPEGIFGTLLVGAEAVAAIIRDPRIKAVTLTGSEGAGRTVASIAGREIKKTVLELGGSDPFIVMPSANVEAAAAVATQARVQNNGQSCIAAKRFIVADSIADRFQEKFVEQFKALRIGDPMEEATEVGPLASESGVQEVNRQVRALIQAGARVLIGGQRPQRHGFFYPPTILTDVPPHADVAQEEVFGPVAMVFRVPDADAAIKLANSTSFGLGASVWTNDLEEQKKFVGEIEAGAVFVNGMVKSDPRLPFGGVKASGYGRELSEFGIREFVNVKTVWIGPAKA